ncbi:MAG: hypothetical protein KIT28_06400 [Rubrivivax sp.]|nr:hypothetical protein [Rubrivivax sp.]
MPAKPVRGWPAERIRIWLSGAGHPLTGFASTISKRDEEPHARLTKEHDNPHSEDKFPIRLDRSNLAR